MKKIPLAGLAVGLLGVALVSPMPATAINTNCYWPQDFGPNGNTPCTSNATLGVNTSSGWKSQRTQYRVKVSNFGQTSKFQLWRYNGVVIKTGTLTQSGGGTTAYYLDSSPFQGIYQNLIITVSGFNFTGTTSTQSDP